MKKEYLKAEVNKIIARSGDPEESHSMEDELHLEIIKEFCPKWVIEQVERLENEDFPRWCA